MVQLSTQLWWALKMAEFHAPQSKYEETRSHKKLLDAIMAGDDKLLRLVRSWWVQYDGD